MKSMTRLLGCISCCALTACGPAEGERIDSNLECAALISASTYLVQSGKVENDPALTKRALFTSMTHLNTYAMPKGIKEKTGLRGIELASQGSDGIPFAKQDHEPSQEMRGPQSALAFDLLLLTGELRMSNRA
jgi:hypothetical protein